jgi:hypothetical protein
MITQKALTNLENIKSKVPIWIKDAIFENAEFIINILQDNQLNKGLDSTGTVVGRYSWATSVFYANNPQNKPRQPKNAGDPYNFEWSGEFFDSMNVKVDVTKQDYDIYSSTGRDKEMESWFGTDLTILTKENNAWVNENIIEPYIAKKIEQNLFNF